MAAIGWVVLAKMWNQVCGRQRGAGLCLSPLLKNSPCHLLAMSLTSLFIRDLREVVLLKDDVQACHMNIFCVCPTYPVLIDVLSHITGSFFYTALLPHTKASYRHHSVSSWYPPTFQTIFINGNHSAHPTT